MKWLARVLPLKWWVYYVAATLGPWVLMMGGSRFFAWSAHAEWSQVQQEATEMAGYIMTMMTACAVIAYGLFRAAYFSPALREAYGDWLRTTPYDGSQPLPLGPMHLVWQDLVFLLTAEAFASGIGLFPWGTATTVMLSLYAVGVALHLGAVDQGMRALATLCAIGLVIRLSPYHPAELLAALGTYALLRPLAALSLKAFARPSAEMLAQSAMVNSAVRASLGQPRVRPRSSDGLASPGECTATLVGWPLCVLADRNNAPRIGYAGSALVAIASGWFCYCLLAALHDGLTPAEFSDWTNALKFFAIMGLAFMLLARMAVYKVPFGCLPPVSALSRIRTGRLIIPGYDKAYLPLLLAPIPLPVLFLSGAFAIWPAGFSGLAMGLTVFILLAMGPSEAEWRMTGRYHLRMDRQRQLLTRL